MDVLATPEFGEWVDGLNRKAQGHVDDRVDRIREYSHFGDTRFLGEKLWELRWRNGRRVYYAIVVGESGHEALMLLGGDKDGQDRDIAQARRILERDGG